MTTQYKLMPSKPTQEILEIACRAYDENSIMEYAEPDAMIEALKASWKAAPAVEQEPVGEVISTYHGGSPLVELKNFKTLEKGTKLYTHPYPLEAEKEQDTLAYREAASLAKSLFKKHYEQQDEDYASGRIVWGLCDTTAGVISQIDNMVSGLVQPPKSEPLSEDFVVEWLLSNPDELDFMDFVRFIEKAHGIGV